MDTIRDCDGHEVTIGSRVRLLRIDPRVLEALSPDERQDVASMLGDVLDVYDLRGTLVCVEKRWDRGDGQSEYHLLSVPGADVQVTHP